MKQFIHWPIFLTLVLGVSALPPSARNNVRNKGGNFVPGVGGGGDMAWTHHDAGNSASASITTATITAAGGSRVFVTVGLSCTGGTATGADDNITITGGGVGWTQVAEMQFGIRRALFAFVSDGTPSSASLSIIWDNGGTDGVWEQGTYSVDSATVNSTPTSNVATDSGVATSGGVTVGGTAGAGDSVVLIIAHATSETVTLEGSQTSLHAATGLTGLRTFNFSYDATATIDQTPSATWSTSDSWGAVGFIVEAP